MNPVSAGFGRVVAMLEDLHGVAVEGQAPSISEDEARILYRALQNGVAQLARLIHGAAVILGGDAQLL